MARNNDGFSEYEKAMIDNAHKILGKAVYCQICGAEILNVGSSGVEGLSTGMMKQTPVPLDSFSKANVHQECYNRYMAERARKEAEATEKLRIEAIKKAREEEDKKNGGQ
jgi:hypothetical protein